MNGKAIVVIGVLSIFFATVLMLAPHKKLEVDGLSFEVSIYDKQFNPVKVYDKDIGYEFTKWNRDSYKIVTKVPIEIDNKTYSQTTMVNNLDKADSIVCSHKELIRAEFLEDKRIKKLEERLSNKEC